MLARNSRIFLNVVPLRGSIDAVAEHARREAKPADRLVALYGQYGAIVYARCRRMLGDAAAAEDVTQDTFLRVLRHPGCIPDENVLPWLYRIATNLCLNAIRDGRVRAIPMDVLPERSGASLDELLANRDLVARLVLRVPPKLQMTAWFFYVDGMRQEEIAEVLGMSRRAVAKRLAQFIAQSRKFLRRDGVKR
jgi:RNA polymerase sigma-70 factor (ECF subfamily)